MSSQPEEIKFNFNNHVRVYGNVKWFNKKQGYGFIHVLTGEQKGKDVFVHYSSIRSKEASDYKYLVQGEYVEFAIEKANKEKHEFNAVDITGICEHPTLCETRRNANYREDDEGAEREGRETKEGAPRIRRRKDEEDKDGYRKVVSRR